MKESHMRKLISILFLLLVTLGLSACAKPPVKAVNSPDEQRSHAQGAQDELSSEIHK
jgi:outer membrane biogenesis lipoprotein LolB